MEAVCEQIRAHLEEIGQVFRQDPSEPDTLIIQMNEFVLVPEVKVQPLSSTEFQLRLVLRPLSSEASQENFFRFIGEHFPLTPAGEIQYQLEFDDEPGNSVMSQAFTTMQSFKEQLDPLNLFRLNESDATMIQLTRDEYQRIFNANLEVAYNVDVYIKHDRNNFTVRMYHYYYTTNVNDDLRIKQVLRRTAYIPLLDYFRKIKEELDGFFRSITHLQAASLTGPTIVAGGHNLAENETVVNQNFGT